MPHAKAEISGRVIAETDDYEVVEGNIYFPPSSVNKSFLTKTDHSTHCPWKGDASYYTINLDKTEMKNAAWFYPEPKEKAKNIKDYVAFCEFSGKAVVKAMYWASGEADKAGWTDKNVVQVTSSE